MNEAKSEALFKLSDGSCPSIPQTRGKKLNIIKMWYIFYISSNKMKVQTYNFKTSVFLSDICFRKKIFQLPLDPLNSWKLYDTKVSNLEQRAFVESNFYFVSSSGLSHILQHFRNLLQEKSLYTILTFVKHCEAMYQVTSLDIWINKSN